MAVEEQMAWLAYGVYKLRSPIAGWKMVHAVQLTSRWTSDKDNFAVYWYEEGKECALAVAGTDNPFDFHDNFNGGTKSGCGFDDIIHAGYMGEVDDLLNSCGFQQEFMPFLSGGNCSGGVHVVGHSLGGGVSSLFSACANNPRKPYGFNVSKLWTFGAPGIAKSPLRNSLTENGCFEGRRIWNERGTDIDPIPGMSRSTFFVHPLIEAVPLVADEHGGIKCDTKDVWRKPNLSGGKPVGSLHPMTLYTNNTNNVWTEWSSRPFPGPQLSDADVFTPAVEGPSECPVGQGGGVKFDYEAAEASASCRVGCLGCLFVLCMCIFVQHL